MCRLFAVRASRPSPVLRPLVLDTNALLHQSKEHPDGWGLAFYVDGQPTIARSIEAAHSDKTFENLSRGVSSDTVVAHVRKASVGALALENTHPFEHGPWVMVHNGTVPEFEAVRLEIEAGIAPAQRQTLRGETDSERIFALVLSALARRCDLLNPDVGVDDVVASIEEAVRLIMSACAAQGTHPSLNIVVTNGQLLLAFRHGRTLFYSTDPLEDGTVARLALSSEKIGGDVVWHEVPEDEFVFVDREMRLTRRRLSTPLPARANAA
jgi:predicted glutamine amidotransferase